MQWLCQKKHTDRNHPPWAGIIITVCVNYFTTGGPGKEHGTNKSPPTGKVQERSKGDTMCPTTSQNSFCWHPSWLSNECTTWKDPWVRMIGQRQPGINPVIIKLETAKYVAEQFSWVLLAYCSNKPFPIKPLALSAHVSPLTILSQVLDKSPLLGLGRGLLSCNSWKGASGTRTVDKLMEHLRTWSSMKVVLVLY